MLDSPAVRRAADIGFLAALVTVVLTVAAGAVAFGRLGSPHASGSHLMADPDDDRGHVSAAARQVRDEPRDHVDVIAIGASAMREALTDENGFAAMLATNGLKAKVHWLASNGQSLAEGAGLLEIADPAPGSIVLLHLHVASNSSMESPMSAAALLETPRIPFIGESIVRQVLTDFGVEASSAPLIMRYRAWMAYWLKQRLDSGTHACLSILRSGHLPAPCVAGFARGPRFARVDGFNRHQYPDSVLSDSVKEAASRTGRDYAYLSVGQSVAFSEAIVRELISRLRSQGVLVYVVLLPSDHRGETIVNWRRDQAAAVLGQATAAGARVLDLGERRDLRDEDFFDLRHLRPHGREVFSPRLAAAVAAAAATDRRSPTYRDR